MPIKNILPDYVYYSANIILWCLLYSIIIMTSHYRVNTMAHSNPFPAIVVGQAINSLGICVDYNFTLKPNNYNNCQLSIWSLAKLSD